MQSYYVQLFCAVLFALLLSNVQSEDERLMGWNKANGLWGKRSLGAEIFEAEQKRPENWAKLNTLWGKRSSSDDLNSFLEKRLAMKQNLDRAQWQMANGLWGR